MMSHCFTLGPERRQWKEGNRRRRGRKGKDKKKRERKREIRREERRKDERREEARDGGWRKGSLFGTEKTNTHTHIYCEPAYMCVSQMT